MIITSAAEDDIPRLLEIEQEAFSPPWTHGALLSEIYRADSFFAVARDSQTEPVLGFVILRSAGGEGELLQIAVDKAARRRGTADLLLRAVIRSAESGSVSSVFLEVRKSNDAAVALYKKHGFQPVSTRKDYYDSPVEDALVMAREA